MINIPAYFPTAIDFTSIFFSEQGSGVYSAKQEPIAEGTASFPLSKWLTIIYIPTFLFFTFRMIWNLFRINLVAVAYEKMNYKGYEIILTNSEILPYSFLNRIFINRKDYEAGKISDELLMHEIYHIQQRHSIDLIIVEVIQTLFWFNPILIFHNRAIRLNHEYMADSAVINNQVELSDYQKILVEAASVNNHLPITSGFSATWTKKRIKMMSKTRSKFSASMRVLLAIPMLFLITVSFIFNDESDELKTEREIITIFNNYPNF